jgi:hypothetical protein
MKNIFKLFIVFVLSISYGCGSSSDDAPGFNPDQTPTPAAKAEAPDLIEPLNGEECSKFSTTNDENIVAVPFRWSNADNASQYEISIEGGTAIQTKTVSGTNTTFDLARDTKYNWHVTGINTDNVKGDMSTTFELRTPGYGVSNTVPYVIIDFLLDKESNMAMLSWEGFDDDGDNLSYNVLIKENDVVILELFDTEQTSVQDFTILDGALYEVTITITDEQNNSSDTIEVKLNV